MGVARRGRLVVLVVVLLGDGCFSWPAVEACGDDDDDDDEEEDVNEAGGEAINGNDEHDKHAWRTTDDCTMAWGPRSTSPVERR